MDFLLKFHGESLIINILVLFKLSILCSSKVHGILENREFLSYLLSRKLTGNYSDHIEEQIELLSKNVEKSLDLSGLISYAHSGQIP